MTANCRRCSAVQLTLAPRSSMQTRSLTVGRNEAMAGRSIPGIIFSTNREIAIKAPVLPALTHASATPSLTRLTATRIDELRLPRSACAGCSSIATTSLAGFTLSRSDSLAPWWRNSRSIASCRPTRMIETSSSRLRKSIAAGTVTLTPWSPPMQSSAMVIAMCGR